MQTYDMKVVNHREIAECTYEITLQTDVFFPAEPGQFVHILVDPPHQLRRPLSLASSSGREITVVYKTFGEGTRTLANKKRGETVNVLGPLGNGFTLPEQKKVMLVGGGVGVPPLLWLAKELHKNGKKVSAVLGFKSVNQVFYRREMEEYAEVTVVTDDGSSGEKGLVTKWLDPEADVYYACGPNPMLKALEAQLTIPGYNSMEERMGCAIGACFACTVETTDGGYVNVCKDGPVFPKGRVKLP